MAEFTLSMGIPKSLLIDSDEDEGQEEEV